MDKQMEAFILGIMNNANDLTLATVRDDGYPQATTVSYANQGLTIYIGTGMDSQKAKNIRRCDKVSLTINTDYGNDWNKIKGLSMGAAAQVLSDPAEIKRAQACIASKFPEWKDIPGLELAETAFLKIIPKVISVLNYEKGFGYTELVKL